MGGTCKTCGSASSLQKCSKCTTLYCSQDCQKHDWKTHKEICGKQAPEQPETVPSPPNGLSKSSTVSIMKSSGYMSEIIAWPQYFLFYDAQPDGVLIDTYRMRVEEEYDFENDAPLDTIHCIGIRDCTTKTTDQAKQYGGGARSNLAGFRSFLRMAATRPGLLPSWWNADKQEKCEVLAMDSSQWHYLGRTIYRDDVIDHYGDGRCALQLRMLGLAVLDLGAPLLMLAMMEDGRIEADD
ncbi:putative MYND domain protein [Xylaria scruposa]|nr:putative MYND domain protein [Xylaria scruposa]